MPTDLKGLIERVESGAGSDRELDFAICAAVNGRSIGATKVTSSLDAVLALIEVKLPGWAWLRDENGTMTVAMRPVGYRIKFAGDSPRPARALLAAALRAIQDSRHDR